MIEHVLFWIKLLFRPQKYRFLPQPSSEMKFLFQPIWFGNIFFSYYWHVNTNFFHHERSVMSYLTKIKSKVEKFLSFFIAILNCLAMACKNSKLFSWNKRLKLFFATSCSHQFHWMKVFSFQMWGITILLKTQFFLFKLLKLIEKFDNCRILELLFWEVLGNQRIMLKTLTQKMQKIRKIFDLFYNSKDRK